MRFRKPVYIEIYNGAIIRSVTTHTNKVGTDWKLDIKVYLETSQKKTQISGVLGASLQVEGKQTLKTWTHVNASSKGDGTLVVDISMNISEVGKETATE